MLYMLHFKNHPLGLTNWHWALWWWLDVHIFLHTAICLWLVNIQDKLFTYKYSYVYLYVAPVDQSLWTHLKSLFGSLCLPLTILMSNNPEISLRYNQTTISPNSLCKILIGDFFDERRYTQPPLITNRFFCYFLLNKKPIFYHKVKMQSNFPKHYLVSCWFFQ